MDTPNLDRFIASTTDEERLTLGLEVLAAAWQEAHDHHLQGWAVDITAYLYALESGRGLNRPL